jgi:glycosyl transferase family 25
MPRMQQSTQAAGGPEAALAGVGSPGQQGLEGLGIWVINLDRAPQRLQRVREQLDALGLPFTRLAAVDARALAPAQRAALDEATYRRRHGMTPVWGELGCYLSHVEVMRAFLAGGWRAALVLEDDVLLHDTLPAVLRGLLARPGRWDMVKLSAVHRGTPVAVADLAPQAPGHRLAVMLSRVTGSSAYLINRAAAQAYLREPGPGGGGLLPMQLPYDHVFDQGWRFGLKVRLVTPTPCTHDDRIASTIDGSPGTAPAGGTAGAGAAPSRKFHWAQRLPAYLYRLGNEARRLRYGLAQLWHERAGRGAG